MAAPISFEEKIDYIYRELKAQKRWRLFKLFIKLAIIWLIITLLNSADKNQIIDSTTKFIWDIVKPITKDIVNDMINSDSMNPQNITKSLTDEFKKNPDLFNKLK